MSGEQDSAGRPTLRVSRDNQIPESAGKETKRLITPRTIDEALTVDVAPDEELAPLDLSTLHDPKEQLTAKYLQAAADLFLFDPTHVGGLRESSYRDEGITEQATGIYYETLDKILKSVITQVSNDDKPLGAMNILDAHISRYAPDIRYDPKTYSKIVDRFKKSYLNEEALRKGGSFFRLPFYTTKTDGGVGGLVELAGTITDYFPDTLPPNTSTIQTTKMAFNNARLLLTEQFLSGRVQLIDTRPELKRIAHTVFGNALKDGMTGYLQRSPGKDYFVANLPRDLPSLAKGEMQAFKAELPQILSILGDQQGTWQTFDSAFSEQFRRTVGVDMREKMRKQIPDVIAYNFKP